MGARSCTSPAERGPARERRLDDLNAERVRGTEGGTLAVLLARTAQSIGFFADGKLKKVPGRWRTRRCTICRRAPRMRAARGATTARSCCAARSIRECAPAAARLEVFSTPAATSANSTRPEFLPGVKAVLVQNRQPPNPGCIEAVDLATRHPPPAARRRGRRGWRPPATCCSRGRERSGRRSSTPAARGGRHAGSARRIRGLSPTATPARADSTVTRRLAGLHGRRGVERAGVARPARAPSTPRWPTSSAASQSAAVARRQRVAAQRHHAGRPVDLRPRTRLAAAAHDRRLQPRRCLVARWPADRLLFGAGEAAAGCRSPGSLRRTRRRRRAEPAAGAARAAVGRFVVARRTLPRLRRRPRLLARPVAAARSAAEPRPLVVTRFNERGAAILARRPVAGVRQRRVGRATRSMSSRSRARAESRRSRPTAGCSRCGRATAASCSTAKAIADGGVCPARPVSGLGATQALRHADGTLQLRSVTSPTTTWPPTGDPRRPARPGPPRSTSC